MSVDVSACLIPPLEEIVAPDPPANCGPYSRANFVAYLAAAHCTENLEFVVELDRLHADLQNCQKSETVHTSPGNSPDVSPGSEPSAFDSLTHQWLVLHKVFIAKDLIKEVNIPWTLRLSLHPTQLPLAPKLAQARCIVYELLLDSYNEFIFHTRECTNDSTTIRRRLEAVAPESCLLCLPHVDVGPHVPHCAFTDALRPNTTDCHRPSAAGLKDQWEKALLDFELGKDDAHETTHPSLDSSNYGLLRSRNGSDGNGSLSRTSRCSSIGSVVEGIKGYLGFKKAVKRLRRSLSDLSERPNRPV